MRHGKLLSEAALQAGVDLNMPCGGQGRCGRCAVIVPDGGVRRRVTLRLSAQDLEAGYALACQTVVEDDCTVIIPPQERIERRLTTGRRVAKVELPFPYRPERDQSVRRLHLTLEALTLADQVDDWSRLQRALRNQPDIASPVVADLPVLQKLGKVLRSSGEDSWPVTAIIEVDTWDQPDSPPRLLDLVPGHVDLPAYGVAIDIGTTTVTVFLVDLESGQAVEIAADYNGQVQRGEDIISRIVYASKDGGLAELQNLVMKTIHHLIERCCRRHRIDSDQVYKAVVAGNPTMLHIFAGIPPEQIRLTPYIPAVNNLPTLRAREVGLNIHPDATVDCLPGVASYMGADISAGILSGGLAEAEELTLFIDIGTNGEIVLGTSDWMLSCACSAGPAFEGAGVESGMRATAGAIEEVWIHSDTFEPTYRVIGGEDEKPRGLCGSGLISLLAELFITGVLDRAGNFNLDLPNPRIREGRYGGEVVVAWAEETATGKDIVFTKVDVDNLLRAKAAIYAGFCVLAGSLDLRLEDVNQFLIGGNFGRYINIEKAIQIGLLPDIPWERFNFLGNTAIRGAYMVLLSRSERQRLTDIANQLTYLELSADNAFYNEFTSALFLPHTDSARFPSVTELLASGRSVQNPESLKEAL